MPDFDKVDLTNCDRLSIHLLGAIQPAGFRVAVTDDRRIARTTASTPEAAHAILDQQKGECAIPDINLGDQTSFDMADRLREPGISYFFASGYGEQANLPMDHRTAAVVQNPYTTRNIARGIDELFPA